MGANEKKRRRKNSKGSALRWPSQTKQRREAFQTVTPVCRSFDFAPRSVRELGPISLVFLSLRGIPNIFKWVIAVV